MGKRNDDNDDINAIVSRVKAEVLEGVKGKNLTITDISLKMAAALDEIRDSLFEEIEKAIEEGRDTEAKCCPDCGNILKKTES